MIPGWGHWAEWGAGDWPQFFFRKPPEQEPDVLVEELDDGEEARVFEWRRDYLIRLRVDAWLAVEAANHVDPHAVERFLRDRPGCPPNMAVELLASDDWHSY